METSPRTSCGRRPHWATPLRATAGYNAVVHFAVDSCVEQSITADLIARAYRRTHGLKVRATRYSNNYGPVPARGAYALHRPTREILHWLTDLQTRRELAQQTILLDAAERWHRSPTRSSMGAPFTPPCSR